MINKKAQAGDVTLIVVFIFILIIIGGGIAISSYVFFSGVYDFRLTEAQIFNYEVKDCLLNNNLISSEGISADKFFQICRFNKDIMEKNNIIMKICENKCESEKTGLISVREVDVEGCDLGERAGRKYPKCTRSTIIIGGKSYEVLTGSNQQTTYTG